MTDPNGDGLRPAFAAIWAESRPNILNRVAVLQAVIGELQAGAIGPERRREAEFEAHKLAGSVGTFGLMEGSRLAREAEELLEGTAPLGPDDVVTLAELVAALGAILARN
jgi:HPt (histidine-containing phosphotransfer) domain-containing protein